MLKINFRENNLFFYGFYLFIVSVFFNSRFLVNKIVLKFLEDCFIFLGKIWEFFLMICMYLNWLLFFFFFSVFISDELVINSLNEGGGFFIGFILLIW